MLQFSHVEDYIELLAGYDPAASQSVIFNSSKYSFSLARYDVSIVESMAHSTVWNNQALTDKQGELAIKLVLKYRRQYANQGIDIKPVEENPTWRMPLRTINRSKTISVVDGEIVMRFPYDKAMIDSVQKYKQDSQGTMRWDHDLKVWKIALTEPNVNWCVAWGEVNQFELSSELQELYKQILECERTPYEIKLVQQADQYTVTNADPSLIDYIETRLGGFGLDNTVKLVDASGVLGYAVDPSIKYPELLDLFGPDRDIHVPSTESGSLDMIFDYAELTGRWPVCIYNPGTAQHIDLSRFSEDEIVRFDPAGRTKTCDYNYYDVKVVYASKIPKHWEWPIPLLVSTVEMMYGGTRMNWINYAEKIIRYNYIKMRDDD